MQDLPFKALGNEWESNKGAAGIDRISIERFEGQAEQYLQELQQ